MIADVDLSAYRARIRETLKKCNDNIVNQEIDLEISKAMATFLANKVKGFPKAQDVDLGTPATATKEVPK